VTIFNQNYHTCFETDLSQINCRHSIKEEIQEQQLTLFIDRDNYCAPNSKRTARMMQHSIQMDVTACCSFSTRVEVKGDTSQSAMSLLKNNSNSSRTCQ
jgi:hypothetical protein